MKKLSIGILALMIGTAAYADAPKSSSVILKSPGDVAPAQTARVSLSSLMKDVHYDINCQIQNTNADPVDMRFQPSHGKKETQTMFGKVTLNGNVLGNLQGTLQAGENNMTVSEVTVSSHGDTSDVALEFKNLDFNNTVQVGQCVAQPSIEKPNMPKSGYFITYNNTGAFVEIAVGNFFPTPYTIFPYSSRWIDVSTDNQNIQINSIY